MARINPNLMQIDGGEPGIATVTPTLSRAQQQAAVRKLTSGQPLTDAEKVFLGIPVSSGQEVPAASTPATDNSAADAAAAAQAELDAKIASTAAANKAEADRLAAFNAAKAAADKAAADKAAADAAAAAAKTQAEREAAARAQAAAQAEADAAARAAANAAANSNSGDSASIKALRAQIDALTKQLSGNTAQQYNDRMSIYSSMADRFNKYGLTGLANKIKELAIAGATEATITLQLQETPEYQQRFAANADRLKKGLAALTPAEYVNVEDSYRQVLRAYGLKQFDNDAYVKQFIANDMSPTELSNRVVTAVQRVQNADPAIVNQLKQYYGIGAQDMVAYVLDPEQQFQKIERQIAASEIGVAAGRQGLTAGVSVAEQLAAQGVTEAEARKGYATIADILPTAEKLSDIYGTTLDEYRQAEGEQEVFNSLASAQRKRQKLTSREIAAFSGSSGTNRTSLTTSAVGQF